jgi:hypothetical protein
MLWLAGWQADRLWLRGWTRHCSPCPAAGHVRVPCHARRGDQPFQTQKRRQDTRPHRLPSRRRVSQGGAAPHTLPRQAFRGVYCQVRPSNEIALRSRVRRFESCWGRINRTKPQNARTSATSLTCTFAARRPTPLPIRPPPGSFALTPPQARARRKATARRTVSTLGAPGQPATARSRQRRNRPQRP